MALTEAQKKLRKAGIGSSDISAIAGLNPYRKPIDVWLEKTGRASDGPDTIQTRVGNAVEEAVAVLYKQDNPRCIFLPIDPPTFIRDGWKVATPDRIVVKEEGEYRRILEIKAVGARVAHHWTDEHPPDYVIAQIIWQQHVCGIDFADVAALIGGTNFKVYEFAHPAELADDLVDIGREFWFNNVVKDIPPEVDSSEAWKGYIAKKWPKAQRATITAPPEAERIAEHIAQHKREIAHFTMKLDTAESEMKELIGNHVGFIGSNWTVTWKNVASGTIDYKGICEMLNVSEATKELFRRPGTRRFLFQPAKDK